MSDLFYLVFKIIIKKNKNNQIISQLYSTAKDDAINIIDNIHTQENCGSKKPMQIIMGTTLEANKNLHTLETGNVCTNYFRIKKLFS